MSDELLDLGRISGGDVIVVVHRRRSRRSYARQRRTPRLGLKYFLFSRGFTAGTRSSSAESLRSLRLLLLRDTPEAVSICCKQLGEFMRFNPPAGCLETPSARPATCKTQTRPTPEQL